MKNLNLTKIFYICAFVIGLLILYFIYDPIIEKVSLNQADRIIDLIKAMLYPVVITIFILLFKDPISYFLRNVKTVKTPGGVELTRQDESANIDAEVTVSENAEDVVLTKEQIEQIAQGYTHLQQSNLDKDEQIKQLTELFEYTAIRAETFEFLYLDTYLVYNTRMVLAWLKDVSGSTEDNYYQNYRVNAGTGLAAQYRTPADDKSEKAAILNALKKSYLIETVDGVLKVTPKGDRYIQHLLGGNK